MSAFHGWQCDECEKRSESNGFKENPEMPAAWTQVFIRRAGVDVPSCLEGRHTFCSPTCAVAWLTDTPRRARLAFEADMEARRAADGARATALRR